ncbi:putative sporulation protein YtxC [Clostridium sp. 19966]|uniref:putative sporulation protein YtxC n=1 Tax=Clostridium sp. 19966 TaxID=2768166 RepID=UPI0028DE8A48|nr:putative sporulation protein YtxC [Clostridium sp. 19966]MDT8716529.1 putative sporulation protein YtxC [Clostridium sp. 19966]
MLLLTIVYQGENDLVFKLNELKEYFKEKNVILGISESIEKDTHFIKIFCGDDNITDKFKKTFLHYVANIVFKILISEFYDREMTNLVSDNYFFLQQDEIRDIEIITMKMLKEENFQMDDTGIYCMNRKNNIIRNIIGCIEENNQININGFMTFRLNCMRNDIEAIIDKVVDKYMIEKEYTEFIRLLKYFVDFQESKMAEINIVVDINGKYNVLDSKGKEAFDEFLNDIDKDKILDNNVEDLIISGLITNSPEKINIYGLKNCQNKEFIDTIKNVFTDRVSIMNEDNMYKHRVTEKIK